MLAPGVEKDLAAAVAEMVHKGAACEAARLLCSALHLRRNLKPHDKPSAYNPILIAFLHDLMEHGGMSEAAQILWSPNQFDPRPISVQEVWNLFECPMGLIMGAAKVGKSFSMGVRLFLEWVRDPEWTSIRVLGPSEDHLEQNLFSHLVALHSNAKLPMPGKVGDLFIGLDRRNQLSSIRGVVIPKGNVKKAGRLQGGHRRPRSEIHPVFGPLSRLFIFLDEIENIPMGVWTDIDNVLSEIEEKGAQGFKVFGAYNPTNSGDEVAKRAEPVTGWSGVDADKHFRWKSSRGWEVLRLDAERCENVVQNKILYPGLQTRTGLETIALNAGGRNSPGYQSMGRGMYPSIGLEATVIPPGMFAKWRGTVLWLEDPQPVGATDLALEGGDDAIHTIGKWGRASGVLFPPSAEFPNGQKVMFKDPKGQIRPRWALQATSQFALPKGDTVATKDNVLVVNRRAGVRPEFYSCDRTGHGAGVADLLRNEWSTLIHDLNYSEGASKEKLMEEDSKTCADQYMRMCSELWFALRMWGEFGYLYLDPTMDMSKLTQQITQRRFRMAGGVTKVESKEDYQSRGFGSPNEADSLTLLVHAARKGSGIVLSMRGSDVAPPGSNSDEDWFAPFHQGGAKVDDSNRTDFLDESAIPEDLSIL